MKKILIVLAGIAIAAAFAFAGWSYHPAGNAQNAEVGPEMASYRGDADISFSYPNSYVLTQRHDSYEGNPIEVLTLVANDVQVPDMSDGPPAISIIEVPNTAGLSLEEWVKEKSISNFSLSPDHKLSSTTAGGEPAVSYVHSGLYESQALAVEHDKKIFLLSVGSLSTTDQLYADFQNLLKTVQFK